MLFKFVLIGLIINPQTAITMKMKFLLCSIVVSLVITSCQKDKPEGLAGTGTGGDGTLMWGGVTYAYKIYYHQAWMIDNLAYLPSVSWSSSQSDSVPYYYVYGYQGSSITEAKATENYKKYGVLYNWQAAKTACPPGWRLPTDQEWKNLENLCGMDLSETDKEGIRPSGTVGKLMKSTSGWALNGNGTNSSHFNVLPGGYRDQTGFIDLSYSASFWSSTEISPGFPWYRDLRNNSDGVRRSYWNGSPGFSVRCLCDW
jgi:uncharacterized protein (TIGR02145 family)